MSKAKTSKWIRESNWRHRSTDGRWTIYHAEYKIWELRDHTYPLREQEDHIVTFKYLKDAKAHAEQIEKIADYFVEVDCEAGTEADIDAPCGFVGQVAVKINGHSEHWYKCPDCDLEQELPLWWLKNKGVI